MFYFFETWKIKYFNWQHDPKCLKLKRQFMSHKELKQVVKKRAFSPNDFLSPHGKLQFALALLS